LRIELLEQHDGTRTAPGVDLVRDQRLELRRRQLLALKLRAHGCRGLAGHEGLRLRQTAGDRQVLLRLVAARGARGQQEVQRGARRALV